MKQSLLSFQAKRTTPTTAKGGKAKAVTASPEVSTPSTPIDISDDSDVETVSSSKSRLKINEPAAKKQKLDSTGKAKAAMFKTRASIENIPEEVRKDAEEEAEHLPQLDPKNKKWNKLYGKAREKMNYLQPIHAEKQNKVHHILRTFDLSYEYGPCIGVSRLDRWERAEALGLNPPPEVKEILMTQQGKEKVEYAQTVFFDEV